MVHGIQGSYWWKTKKHQYNKFRFYWSSESPRQIHSNCIAFPRRAYALAQVYLGNNTWKYSPQLAIRCTCELWTKTVKAFSAFYLENLYEWVWTKPCLQFTWQPIFRMHLYSISRTKADNNEIEEINIKNNNWVINNAIDLK